MSLRAFGGICLIALLCSWIADAQTTVRPYKFGFNIDEQQHRSEQRDERGIVMGEFGFITADGIYHVTVYATDEEGRFRILAMRSYPYEAQPKIIEMVVAPKPKAKPSPSPPKTDVAKFNFNTMACSGCFLKNAAPKVVTTPANIASSKPKTQIQTLSKPFSRIAPGGPAEVPITGTGTMTNVAVQRAMAEKALTQVLSDVSLSDRLEAPIRSTVVGGVKHTKDVIRMADTTQSHRHQQSDHKVHKQITPSHTMAKASAATTQHHTTYEPHTSEDHLHIAESAPGQQTAHTPLSSTQTRYKDINSYTNTNTNTQKQIPLSTATHLTKTKSSTAGTPIISTQTQGKLQGATSFALPEDLAENYPLAFGSAGPVKPPAAVPSNAPTGPTGTFKGTGIQQPDKRPSSLGSKGGAIGGIGTGQQTDKKTQSLSGNGGLTSGIGTGKGTSNSVSGIVGAKAAGGDLYRFKYSLDYHGHKETGSRNGNKVGSYVVIGDDNIERTLEYIANENGYYPKIKWRKLDAPVASKENTLKESEFVWFNSKQ